MGYIIYRVERPDWVAPETIRLRPEDGSVYYEGGSASLLNAYADGLPFYVMDGRLSPGQFPPPEVVGEERTLASITGAVDLLGSLLTQYLETGSLGTSV
jgi:hypothetical protein